MIEDLRGVSFKSGDRSREVSANLREEMEVGK